MMQRIICILLLFISAYSGGFTQVDSLGNMQWDDTIEVNPYESPSDVVFDFSSVEAQYRDLLDKMNELSTKYSTSIKVTKMRLESSPKNKALRSHLRSQTKQEKNINRDSKALMKIYDQNGVSVKLHKAIKKYSKRYFPEDSKSNVVTFNEKKIQPSRVSEESSKQSHNFEYYTDNILSSYTNYPETECDILYNGVDSETLAERKQMASKPFFYYTHPKLKTFYKNQSFLQGEASVMELGKETYISYKITIRSKDALRNYGMIPANSLMRIKTISGDNIYLPAINNSQGSINEESGITTIYVAFAIDKENKRLLRNSDIDNIGIMWSSGFEEYDVFYVDLIKEQLDCLRKL